MSGFGEQLSPPSFEQKLNENITLSYLKRKLN